MNEYEKLLDLLGEGGTRISIHNGLWITYCDGVWTVYCRPYGKQKTRTMYEGESLSVAIDRAKGNNQP